MSELPPKSAQTKTQRHTRMVGSKQIPVESTGFMGSSATVAGSDSAESYESRDGKLSWDELQTGSGLHKTSILVRLTGAITMVLLFSIAANSFLNYFSFQKSYQQIMHGTFSAIVEELGFKIESSLNLGLPLHSIANIPSLLSATSQYHDNVRFLVVESPVGEVYFSTGEFHRSLAEYVSSNFIYDEERDLWISTTPQMTVIGYELFNSYQQPAGRLLLGYDQRQVNYVQNNVAWSLVKDSAGVLAVFIVFVCLSLYIIIYKFRHRLFDLEQQLIKIANRSEISPQVSLDMERIDHSLLSPLKNEIK